jgi:hypothetical protein
VDQAQSLVTFLEFGEDEVGNGYDDEETRSQLQKQVEINTMLAKRLAILDKDIQLSAPYIRKVGEKKKKKEERKNKKQRSLTSGFYVTQMLEGDREPSGMGAMDHDLGGDDL